MSIGGRLVVLLVGEKVEIGDVLGTLVVRAREVICQAFESLAYEFRLRRGMSGDGGGDRLRRALWFPVSVFVSGPKPDATN